MVKLAIEAVAGIAVLLAARVGYQHQILEAAGELFFESEAGGERRVPLDQVFPLLSRAQKDPRLAVARSAAKEGGPANDQDVGLAQGHTANAQLLLPRIRGIKAGLLDLGGDLPDLGRRDTGFAERVADPQEAGLGQFRLRTSQGGRQEREDGDAAEHGQY